MRVIRYSLRPQVADFGDQRSAGTSSADFVPDEVVNRFCLFDLAAAHVDRLRELAEIGDDQFPVPDAR